MKFLSRIAVAALLLAGCSSPSGGECDTAVFESGYPNSDARASSDDDFEVWGLFYPPGQDVEGQPVVIQPLQVWGPGDDEPRQGTKIVWRVTGDGDFLVEARAPSGAIVQPFWVEKHLGSEWSRPGEEWGTGWELPETGCWTFIVSRGAATSQISIEVTQAA